MVDSLGSCTPLPPAELVGNRISEKLFFEARFLFNKFSQDIDPVVRKKLQQQLAVRISKAEQSFAVGEQFERADDLEKAKAVYADVAATVVDYPGLAEAQQRVELAIQLGPLLSVEPAEPEVDSDLLKFTPPVTPQVSLGRPAAGGSFFQQKNVLFGLGFSLLCTVGLVTGWMSFYSGKNFEVTRSVVLDRVEKTLGEPIVVHPALQPVAGAEIISLGEKPVSLSSQLVPSDKDAPVSGEGEVVTLENKPTANDDRTSPPDITLRSSFPLQKSKVKDELLIEKQAGIISESINLQPPSVPEDAEFVMPERTEGPAHEGNVEEGVSIFPPALIEQEGKSRAEVNPERAGAFRGQTDIQVDPQQTPLQMAENEEVAVVLSHQDDAPLVQSFSQEPDLVTKVGKKMVETTTDGADAGNSNSIFPLQGGSAEPSPDLNVSIREAVSSEANVQLIDAVPVVEVPVDKPVSKSNQKYTVSSGDTLESIAGKVYGNRYKWSHIVAANQELLGRPPYLLSVGMQLDVPPLEMKKGVDLLNNDGSYTVQSGDTLGSIAWKVYGSSKKWNALYQLNRDTLPTPGSLAVGQALNVNKEEVVSDE